jgi:hypothetical protein
LRLRSHLSFYANRRIEASNDDSYLGIYGFAPRFGAKVAFATLEEALRWANHGGGGVF